MGSITRIIWFLLLLGLAVGSPTPSSNETTLNFLLQHKDDSADPCEDFQEFSSGKFVAVNKRNNVYGLTQAIIHQMNIRTRKVLEHLRDRVVVDESSVEEKVWRFYDACLRAPVATKSWRHYLELVPPGTDLVWPLLRPYGSLWPIEKFHWLEALARLRRFGVENLIIRMEVNPIATDVSQRKLYVHRPEMKSNLSLETTKNLLIRLGHSWRWAGDLSWRWAGKLALDIISLENELNGLPRERDYVIDMTIEQFEDHTQIALSTYLEIVLGSADYTKLSVTVGDLRYMEKLQQVMAKYNQLVVVNYLMVKFIHFLSDLPGSQANGDPLVCSTAVRTHFPLASELLYKNYYFRQGRHQRNDQEVQQLFQHLREGLLARLDRNRLNLTAKEVFFLKEKLRTITVRLGVLPNVPDQRRFVNAFYSDLLVDPVLDLARIQLAAQEHQTAQALWELNVPIVQGNRYFRLSQIIAPLDSLPYFGISGNVIIVPYDILQDPFFSPNQHDVFKVSLLGYYLAYLMLKTLDLQHLKYDSKMKISDLMEHFVENERFIEGVTCLNRTQAPDVLDLVNVVDALHLSYDVYFGEDSKFSREQPSFTDLPLEQLFLLNFGQTFVGRDEYFKYDLNSDVQNLHEAVRNLRAFGEVFKCPVSAKLNPPIKCNVW